MAHVWCSRHAETLSAVVIAVAATLAILLATATGVAASAVSRTWDVLFPSGTADPRIMIVAIDEAALDEVGEWPWTWDRQAELIEHLAALDPTVIGYDVVLAHDQDGVERFADAFAASTTVATEAFESATLVDGQIFLVSGAVPPAPAIVDAATLIGHAVVTADADGVVRTVPLMVQTPEGEFMPSLAAAVADLADGGADQLLLRPDAVQMGAITAPVERGATLRVDWTGSFGATTVSAADVLDGTADPALFRNALVLVGATATALGDRHVTPVQPGATTPGIVVQAEVLNTLITQQWIVPAPLAVTAVLTLLMSFAAAWVAVRRRLLWSSVVTILLIAGYAVLAVVAFGADGTLLDLVRVPVLIALSAVAGIAVRLIRQGRENRRTVDLFTRYVPEDVALGLLRSGDADRAGAAHRVEVAMVFCDLRGFTPLAATLRPEQVTEILNLYYDYACAAIFAHGGTVMQFVGDEVFAVFGAPVAVDDPILRARHTGLALQAERRELDATLRAAGLPPVEFGVSVHVGDVVAAHVGPRERRQYSVVGDAVNVASRLCGVAAAGDVVVSTEAGGDTDLPGAVPERVSVKGISGEIAIVRIRSALAPDAGSRDDSLRPTVSGG